MSNCPDERRPGGCFPILPGTPSKSVQECGVQKRLEFILTCLTQPVNRLLDVWCGEGAYLVPLSSHSVKVVGVDLNDDYLNTARTNYPQPDIYLARMVSQRLAFVDGVFDTIILIETLEHLVDGRAAIAEMARMLRPEGLLLISVPNKLFPIETHSIQIGGNLCGSRWGTGTPLLPLLSRWIRRRFATVRLYYTWELRKLLTDCGFIVRKVDHLMPSLDSMERQLAWTPLARWLRWLSAWLERSPFRRLGSTILMQAERVST